MGLLWFLQYEKFNEIVFSFKTCVSLVMILFFLGTYVVAPHLFRNLLALIGKQQLTSVVGPILDNEENQEKTWEKKKDLTISESTQVLHDSNAQTNTDLKIKEVITAFENKKYSLVIRMKDECLADIKNNKQESFYRFLLEMSYNELEEYDVEERISNLFLLCSKFNNFFPTDLVISFQCNLAWLYAQQKQVDKAKNILTNIFNRINSKECALSHEIYSKINDLQSTILLKENHPALALSYLERAWNFSNDSAWYGFKIARIYSERLHDPVRAIEHAKSAFSLLTQKDGPELYEALVHLCFYLEAFLGNFQSAYEFIEQYHMKSPYVLACKAYIATKLCKYEEAFSLAQQVIDKDPSQSTAINAKGIVHLKRKEFTIAERYFSAVIPDFEKSQDFYVRFYTAEAYYHRGICNIKLNNPKQALLDFRKAEEMGYTDFDANYLDVIQQYIVENHEKTTYKLD